MVLTIKLVSRTISYSSSHKLYASGSKVLFIGSPWSGSKICSISRTRIDVSSSLKLFYFRLRGNIYERNNERNIIEYRYKR